MVVACKVAPKWSFLMKSKRSSSEEKLPYLVLVLDLYRPRLCDCLSGPPLVSTPTLRMWFSPAASWETPPIHLMRQPRSEWGGGGGRRFFLRCWTPQVVYKGLDYQPNVVQFPDSSRFARMFLLNLLFAMFCLFNANHSIWHHSL